jgi:uncharacterized membrane protein (UPF0136 family)
MLVQGYYIIFGILAIGGGIAGYVRAKSKPSLIAGGLSGALLIMAGLMPSGVGSTVLALAISLLLLIYFGRSYASKRKPMPAIPMIVLSAICILLTIAKHFF